MCFIGFPLSVVVVSLAAAVLLDRTLHPLNRCSRRCECGDNVAELGPDGASEFVVELELTVGVALQERVPRLLEAVASRGQRIVSHSVTSRTATGCATLVK
jgi:hypothetical protein